MKCCDEMQDSYSITRKFKEIMARIASYPDSRVASQQVSV
jgi:hypothetical protein